MPEGGKYEKLPRPDSIKAFKNLVSSREFVNRIEPLGPQLFKVVRIDRSDIVVHLTNIYIVGEADVLEILAGNPDIDCIVTVSAWNSYTNQAKLLAKENNIGLFKFKEFLGAVYYDGKRFMAYQPPDPYKEGKQRNRRF